MGSQWAAVSLQTFSLRWFSLEAGVTAAASAAGSRLGSQFQDREFGKQSVHAPNRAEIATPKPFFKHC